MPTHHLTQMEAIDQFQQFMQDNGISPPSSIEADGQIHRYHIEGQKSGSKNGAYAFYYNGHGSYGGWVRNWTLGEQTFNWSSHSQSDFLQLSPKQRESIKQEQQHQREQSVQEIKNRHQHGIKNAVWIWEQAQACHSHPYLENKQLLPVGLRVLDKQITLTTYSNGEITYYKGALIIPVVDSEGNSQALQVIYQSKGKYKKRFLKDTTYQGGFIKIGSQLTLIIYICEGWATGKSIYDATDCLVVVAFNGENLKKVAEIIQAKVKDKDIRVVLACDNDQFKEINGGIKAGKDISRQLGIPYTYPLFHSENLKGKPTDFNDLHQLYGLGVVERQLKTNLTTLDTIKNTPKTDKSSQPIMPTSEKEYKKRMDELSKLDPFQYLQKRESLVKEIKDKIGVNTTLKDVDQEVRKQITKRKRQAKKLMPLDQYPLISTDNEGKERLLAHNQAGRVLMNEIDAQAFDPISENWMAYKETGIWEPITTTEQWSDLELRIYQLGGQVIGCSKHYIDGVNAILKGLLVKRFDQLAPKHLLPFKNGVLDLNNPTLLPHHPDHLLTWQLPYDYQEGKDCESFVDFLVQSVKHEDQINILIAYINAVIKGRADLQKYLELIGFGGTGKGVFLSILIALVGSQNCHSTSLKILAKDKFEIANLYQKRLVIITDAEKWSGDIAQFKAITGQDLLRYEDKFEPAKESFVYQGMVVLAANHHISTNDNSSGIQRRRITLLFDHVVSTEQCDTDLANKLSQSAPQIVNWALSLSDDEVTEMLLNPVKYAPSMAKTELETMQATNPIAGWAMDNLEPEPEQKVQIGTLKQYSQREGDGGSGRTESFYHNEEVWLYPNFAQWFNQNNHNDRYSKRISIREFRRTVIDILGNVLKWGDIKEITPKGKAYIKGIKIKEKEETD